MTTTIVRTTQEAPPRSVAQSSTPATARSSPGMTGTTMPRIPVTMSSPGRRTSLHGMPTAGIGGAAGSVDVGRGRLRGAQAPALVEDLRVVAQLGQVLPAVVGAEEELPTG